MMTKALVYTICVSAVVLLLLIWTVPSGDLQQERPLGKMFFSSLNNNTHYAKVNPMAFILAYHRTGSSFTGAVLRSYPGAFYLFEPLHATGSQYARGRYTHATFFNGTKVPISNSILEFLRKEEVRALATCDFERLPYEMFFDDMHLGHNDSLASFAVCARGKSLQYALGCLHIVREKCLTAPLRVMKFVRLRLSQVEELDLLHLYPHIKFIHLVRDPRGNALSQLHKVPGTASDIASTYCQTLRDDLVDKARISENYSDRIYTLRYESLANYPLQFTREMLQFIDTSLNLTKKMERYIKDIAVEGAAKNCNYCVERGNGSKMASKWRLHITEESYKGINAVCGDILDTLRYNRFEGIREVRNLTIPLITDIQE